MGGIVYRGSINLIKEQICFFSSFLFFLAFAEGIGRIYKENETWTYDTYAYLAGVYKGKKLYGNIYNLEEEQIGTIGAYFGYKLIVRYIQGMDGKKAPIVGFLFYNDEYFAGRIMSTFGPALHIFGKYTPN